MSTDWRARSSGVIPVSPQAETGTYQLRGGGELRLQSRDPFC